MKKNLCKIVFFLCCFIFSISSAFARSQNSPKEIGGRSNGSGFASRQGTANSKNKKQQAKTSSQTEPRYRGDLQFALGVGTLALGLGIENHNMFRVTPFEKVNFYLGFMESAFFSVGGYMAILDFTIGGALGLKFSKVAFVQAGLGLDIGNVISPSSFIAPAFFFELQAKFFPNAVFSPLIGMKFTKFNGISVSLNSFFVGGSLNFRKKK